MTGTSINTVTTLLVDLGTACAGFHDERHAGMTRRQLAERAHMSQQGINKIERGGNVTLGTLVLLANALGC